MPHPKRPDDPQWVPEDDAVIGRAFRWSIVVLVLLGGAAALAWWMLGRSEERAAPVELDAPAPEVQAGAPVPPDVTFTDVTAQAGIDFVHENGATGEKLLPETMGGGALFFDYDGNGTQDLLLVQSDTWPWSRGDGPRPGSRFYANDGAGKFTVVDESGFERPIYGMGAAAGDVDADGDPDVFIAAVGANRFYRNVGGGRFRDDTARAGLAGDPEQWSSSAAFFDYDNDGDLDLWVCNYVQWSKEIDLAIDFKLTGVGRAYGPPTNFSGSHSYLYRNDGKGNFTDVSERAGLHVSNPATGVPIGKALAVGITDLGQDGDLDVLVANDTTQNFLFVNNGDGTFSEQGSMAGVGFDSAGNATGAMGVDAADFRNEGMTGIAIGNFANEMTSLYVAAGAAGMQFTDEAIVEGIGAPSRKQLSFGLFFFDYDLDGRLDLLQANGHLEEEINQVQPSQHYRQPAQLFWNAGPDARASFVEVPAENLGDLGRPIVGRGAAYADIDGDGDLDVLLTQTGGPPLLLRNDQQTGHHWLRVSLADSTTPGNPDGVGAVVRLTQTDGTVQTRTVMPPRSYLSQVEAPLTFGLGTATAIESLTVTWPDGTQTDATAEFALDRPITIAR